MITGADFYQNVSRSRVNAPKAHYRVPVLVTTNAIQSGKFVGAAKYALASFLERLPGRPLTYTDYASQREAPLTHLQVGEAALLIEDAEARAHRFADLIAGKVARGEPWSTEERVRARVQIGWIARQSKAAVDILASASGGSSIHRDVPVTRIQRDLHAASLHAMITPGVNIELYGRSLTGLEPNTAYLERAARGRPVWTPPSSSSAPDPPDSCWPGNCDWPASTSWCWNASRNAPASPAASASPCAPWRSSTSAACCPASATSADPGTRPTTLRRTARCDQYMVPASSHRGRLGGRRRGPGHRGATGCTSGWTPSDTPPTWSARAPPT
ncbi:hypothetical protein SFUMM280S_09205 [Streptomyces fumanus]